jgi:hypothetical protein
MLPRCTEPQKLKKVSWGFCVELIELIVLTKNVCSYVRPAVALIYLNAVKQRYASHETNIFMTFSFRPCMLYARSITYFVVPYYADRHLSVFSLSLSLSFEYPFSYRYKTTNKCVEEEVGFINAFLDLPQSRVVSCRENPLTTDHSGRAVIHIHPQYRLLE